MRGGENRRGRSGKDKGKEGDMRRKLGSNGDKGERGGGIDKERKER